MLVGGMVQHQLGDHPQPPLVGLPQKLLKLPQGIVAGIDIVIIGNIVPIIPQRRRVERQHPERRNPQLLQVVQLADQTTEVPHAVGIGIGKGLDMHLVNNRITVPGGVVFKQQGLMWHHTSS